MTDYAGNPERRNPLRDSKRVLRPESRRATELDHVFQQIEALADFYVGSDPLQLKPDMLEGHQRRISEAKRNVWEIRKQRTDISHSIDEPVSLEIVERGLQTAEKHLGQIRQYAEAERKPDKYFNSVHGLSDTLKDLVIQFRRGRR